MSSQKDLSFLGTNTFTIGLLSFIISLYAIKNMVIMKDVIGEARQVLETALSAKGDSLDEVLDRHMSALDEAFRILLSDINNECTPEQITLALRTQSQFHRALIAMSALPRQDKS